MLACAECMEEKPKLGRCRRCKVLICPGCEFKKVHVCYDMRLARMADITQEDIQVKWLVEGLLPDVGWTLCYGERGVGKTTFVLQLCAALQLGIPFLDRDTIQTDVLYLQADSKGKEWQAIIGRVAPKCKAWTLIDVPERALGNPKYVDAMKVLKNRVRPGIIVFDSLYNLVGNPGNINGDKVLLEISVMKAIAGDTPWILIHHPPHGENRASGHNSLGGNCSNDWGLLKTKLNIAKSRLVGTQEILLNRSLGASGTGLWSLKRKDNDGNSGINMFVNARVI